nr:TPA_asm: m74.7 sORF 2 [Murid betaherpesvirus 1]DBA07830.1 TPA_asm: m74.7 sORF 2 [Murid betaherpesvirus 1]
MANVFSEVWSRVGLMVRTKNFCARLTVTVYPVQVMT